MTIFVRFQHLLWLLHVINSWGIRMLCHCMSHSADIRAKSMCLVRDMPRESVFEMCAEHVIILGFWSDSCCFSAQM